MSYRAIRLCTTSAVTIPADWGQGRATFGGLMVALQYEAMRAHVPAERTLRSLSVSFVGPAEPGVSISFEVEVLREGKAVSQVLGRAMQNGQVVTLVQGSFGAARESVVSIDSVPSRSAHYCPISRALPLNSCGTCPWPGLWGADGQEEYWLTAYITDFLLRARDQGYAVPRQALQQASQRLMRYVQERNLIEADYSDNLDHTRFAVQAYAALVLARSQQAPLGALRNIFERRSDALSGLPLVQLSIALQKMGDQPRADQALAAGLAVTRKGDQWLGDYGSPLRDQALILALLEENDLMTGQREQRLFDLSDQLAASPWLSTQERNSLFLAGRDVLAKPQADWSAQLTSGGQTRDLNNRQSGMKLDGPLLNTPLSVRNEGHDTVYQQLTISGYPQQAPVAGGENMSIRRDYLRMSGEPLDLTSLKSGDLVLVHLAVTAKQPVPDALVVDLLPAGLELENQNLGQSAASLENASTEVKLWREAMQNANVEHQEYRDDRYVAALKLEGSGTAHLLYLARAVTPGTYRVPPPQVESMYRPNWQAVGETPGTMVIKGR